jgi:hypothetical protein
MIIVPARFKNDADGPCHTPALRQQFWTDVLTSLVLSYDTLFEAARQYNATIKEYLPNEYIQDLEARIVTIQTQVGNDVAPDVKTNVPTPAQLYAKTGAISGIHPLLYQTPWAATRRKRYAMLFQSVRAYCPSDGAGAGEARADRTPPRASAHHTRVAPSESVAGPCLVGNRSRCKTHATSPAVGYCYFHVPITSCIVANAPRISSEGAVNWLRSASIMGSLRTERLLALVLVAFLYASARELRSAFFL